MTRADAAVGSQDGGAVEVPPRDAPFDAGTALEPDADIDVGIDTDVPRMPVDNVPIETSTSDDETSDETSTGHTVMEVEVPDEPIVDASVALDDAGVDAGTVIDAGTTAFDAGTPDASEARDAGTAFDAGVADAGARDAAPAPAPVPVPVPDAGPDPLPVCSGPPGLYSDDHCSVIAAGIRAFKPQYPSWSDGAAKQRFVYLPPGTTIDTSNADRWSFPTGTRLYKEFSKNGTRVETRLLEKTASGTGIANWTLNTYAWSADQLSVTNVATGVNNALGTGLDIPTQAQCSTCHSMTNADAPIGFNAIQLNHSDAGVTLAALIGEGLLVNGTPGAAANVSVANAVIPGDAITKAGLGYLHGNCGHCHGGPNPRAGMRLWSVVGTTDPSQAPIFQTAVCHCIERWTLRTNSAGEFYRLRVAPSRAAISGIIGRMSRRGEGEQMPPLGTNIVDATGLAAVQAWIDSLDGSACDLTGAVDATGASCP